jgi:hypothetical protein
MSTSRPFAYNTGSPIDGTIQVGNLAIGYPTSGFTGTEWWNGPDEDLGYVIAQPVSGDTQPTNIFSGNLTLSSTYKGIDISLSNNNQTATQLFGYQQSVLGQTLIDNVDKVMFSVQSNVCAGPGNPFFQSIGVGTTSMNYSTQYGAYPGNDTQSVGFSMDGNFYFNGSLVQSGLPTWTTNNIIDIAVDLYNYLIWIRVNGGGWAGNPAGANDPSTNQGGLSLNGLTSFYPVLSPGNDVGQMTIQNSAIYGLPEGYQLLGSNLTGSVGFFRTSGFNDSEFVDIANILLNSNYDNVPDASTGLTTNGFWNSYSGILIPTDGLTLYVDAGLNLSYSGSGTQWYDLSGNNNTGTLQNSPTYSPSDGGTLTFNGSQYISFSSPTNIPIGNSNYTISVWFNPNSLGGNGLVGWGNWGGGNQVNAFRLGGSSLLNYWWGNDLAASASITTNTWYNAIARFDGTNRQIWVNNVMINQDTPGSGHNVPNADNMKIGVTNNTEYFNGKISNVEIYNRVLSDSEIGIIFDNLKSRFGL